MNKTNKKIIGLFELFLIISISFSFSFLISRSNNYFSGPLEESNAIKKTRQILLGWLDNGLVSAQASLWTCLENNEGTLCQEYPSTTCNEQCTEDCFPGRRSEFAECRLGTCVDNDEGTCLPNTPAAACTAGGGQWFEQAPAQCNPGCCIIGDQTRYITEATCSVIGERRGMDTQWEVVSNEIECLALAQQQEEGACVLEYIEEEAGYNCKFGTKSECLSLGGDFKPNLLCSNPDLQTVCEKQEATSCIEGKNEVYWVDSCGNRENIYDNNKVKSWNDGRILAKEDSCSLETGSNPLGNQRTCGNCEYLLGSVCGEPGEGDRAAAQGEFICKDLSCVEDDGTKRKNGESWCAFDSSIGVDNENKANTERSVDVPGSGHYRKVCFDGEIRTEPCAEFRNEVCVEQRDEQIDFSSAACRINQWQLCLESNTDKAKLDKCETYTDCSLHSVALDDFKFDVCVPKNPPGFDLKVDGGGDVGEQICGMASQTCTAVEEKKISGWKCVYNCDCIEDQGKFAETMNNLCISLGDCGGHINIAGKYSDSGYSVFEDDNKGNRVGQSYKDDLRKYAEPKKGQKVEPLTNRELSALFGIPEASFEQGNFGDFLGKVGLGGTGVLLVYSAIKFEGVVPLYKAITGGQGLNLCSAGCANGEFLGGFAKAAGGAAAGAAIGYLIGKAFGLEGDGLLLATVAGAVTGVIAATGLIGPSQALLSFGFLLTVVIAVLIAVLIIKLLGFGETREIEVRFECNAWQPPLGGKDCDLCGNDDGLPCTKYKCQSYGQACEFINEGTDAEACVDIAAGDSSAPIISFDERALTKDYRIEEQDNGVRVELESGDGCIKEFTPISIGLKLDEPGQCKIEGAHSESFDDMSSFFGNSNLFKEKHGMITIMPPILDGVGPDRREDYNLYVRCQDYNGNDNVKEYVINFCVKPGDDLTAPIITKFVPPVGYATLNASEKSVQFYTNEPAKCKYDIEDKSYNLMKNNSVICNNAIRAGTIDGWLCNTVLPVTSENEKDYYFRCSDQPWLLEDDDTENNNKINVNAQSFVYKITKSKGDLVLSGIAPNNEIITSGTEPVSVELRATTSGGIDGKAFCEYSFDGSSFIDFFETSTTTHRQRFTGLFEGSYNIRLMCTDVAGNVAQGSSIFEISVDSIGPEITRVYQQPQGTLNVITNEPAECRYDLTSCSFNFVNGTSMSGSDRIHTSRIENGLRYHVKCRDDYGNAGSCLAFTGGY